uniref:Uncharacterized protein n=1 Tax=Amphimedon queenslandica TaxID=400682 RepID=A0A1X7THR3_AMPQE
HSFCLLVHFCCHFILQPASCILDFVSEGCSLFFYLLASFILSDICFWDSFIS